MLALQSATGEPRKAGEEHGSEMGCNVQSGEMGEKWHKYQIGGKMKKLYG
jgi:hypothetical protein